MLSVRQHQQYSYHHAVNKTPHQTNGTTSVVDVSHTKNCSHTHATTQNNSEIAHSKITDIFNSTLSNKKKIHALFDTLGISANTQINLSIPSNLAKNISQAGLAKGFSSTTSYCAKELIQSATAEASQIGLSAAGSAVSITANAALQKLLNSNPLEKERVTRYLEAQGTLLPIKAMRESDNMEMASAALMIAHNRAKNILAHAQQENRHVPNFFITQLEKAEDNFNAMAHLERTENSYKALITKVAAMPLKMLSTAALSSVDPTGLSAAAMNAGIDGITNSANQYFTDKNRRSKLQEKNLYHLEKHFKKYGADETFINEVENLYLNQTQVKNKLAGAILSKHIASMLYEYHTLKNEIEKDKAISQHPQLKKEIEKKHSLEKKRANLQLAIADLEPRVAKLQHLKAQFLIDAFKEDPQILQHFSYADQLHALKEFEKYQSTPTKHENTPYFSDLKNLCIALQAQQMASGYELVAPQNNFAQNALRGFIEEINGGNCFNKDGQTFYDTLCKKLIKTEHRLDTLNTKLKTQDAQSSSPSDEKHLGKINEKETQLLQTKADLAALIDDYEKIQNDDIENLKQESLGFQLMSNKEKLFKNAVEIETITPHILFDGVDPEKKKHPNYSLNVDKFTQQYIQPILSELNLQVTSPNFAYQIEPFATHIARHQTRNTVQNKVAESIHSAKNTFSQPLDKLNAYFSRNKDSKQLLENLKRHNELISKTPYTDISIMAAAKRRYMESDL